jgi:hypothetical protein
MFGGRAFVNLIVPRISLLSCLVMATEFVKKGDDAEWDLVIEGSNDDEDAHPTVTQAMVDLLTRNSSCDFLLEGTVEPQTSFLVAVRSKSV